MTDKTALVELVQDGALCSRLSSFELAAIRTGLEALFRKRHFSISDLDTLCNVAGVHMSSRLRNTLGSLHCVNYGDMDLETRRGLYESVLGLFEQPVFNLDRIRTLGRTDDGKPIH